uniref:Uncharacterized protein n=1 Tax=Arundo donax TaxID=35708 RepID=A0A0A8XQA7_ARUDO
MLASVFFCSVVLASSTDCIPIYSHQFPAHLYPSRTIQSQNLSYTELIDWKYHLINALINISSQNTVVSPSPKPSPEKCIQQDIMPICVLHDQLGLASVQNSSWKQECCRDGCYLHICVDLHHQEFEAENPAVPSRRD